MGHFYAIKKDFAIEVQSSSLDLNCKENYVITAQKLQKQRD